MSERYDHETFEERFVIQRLYKVPGSPYWQARIRDKRSGKVRRRSSGETSQRKALEAIRVWLRGFLQPSSELTPRRMRDALREWGDYRDIRETTRKDWEWTLEGLLLPTFGPREVASVSPAQVEDFLRGLRERGRAPRTVRKHLMTLRSFFKWARRRGYCLEDPTRDVPSPRIPKTSAGYALSEDEARRILRAAGRRIQKRVRGARRRPYSQAFGDSRPIYRGLLLSLYTGLRRRNVLGLRWGDVDLAAGRIDLPADRMKSNAEHTVPIHPALERELRRALAEDGALDPVAPVIGRKARTLNTSWRRVLREAGLPARVRWHDLRHTFATWMASRCTYAVLQALLGHAPRGVTGAYLHVPFGELAEAVRGLPDLLRQPSQKKEEKGA